MSRREKDPPPDPPAGLKAVRPSKWVPAWRRVKAWTAGLTTPRMKSTSATRRPHASASRILANAPTSTAARSLSGIARLAELAPRYA